MKYFIKSINKASYFTGLLFTVIAIFLSSCKEQILNNLDIQSQNKSLMLTSAKGSIILNEADASTEGLNLTWTSGSNQGTNAAIAYTLYISKKGDNFKKGIVEDLGKTIFQKKYSVEDFNAILLSQLNLVPNLEQIIEAKVVSKVLGTQFSDSTTTSITVKPYLPVSKTLFLSGTANPKGADENNADALILNTSFPGRFIWQGKLNAGEFKLITTKGNAIPSYSKGSLDTKLVLRNSVNDPELKFAISQAGPYSIAVNLLDLTISIQQGAAPAYDKLWIVGDATPNGWNINNPNELRVDRSDRYVFTYNEVLNAGEFKLPTGKGNWGGDFYMPLVNYQNLSLSGVKLSIGGNPDYKWKITNAGAYKILLNITPGSESIKIKPFTAPSKVWIVGDATPNGWDIGNATALTVNPSNPNEFTYTGNLTAGELKFPLQKDFSGDFYMPVINGEGAESVETKFVAGGNPDNKWKITASQAGSYKITINVLYETVKFQKQ